MAGYWETITVYSPAMQSCECELMCIIYTHCLASMVEHIMCVRLHDLYTKIAFVEIKWQVLSMIQKYVHISCTQLPSSKYRQVSRIWKEGCLQIICDNFLSDPRYASRKRHSCRVGWGAFCMRNRIRNRIKNRMCKRALRQGSNNITFILL